MRTDSSLSKLKNELCSEFVNMHNSLDAKLENTNKTVKNNNDFLRKENNNLKEQLNSMLELVNLFNSRLNSLETAVNTFEKENKILKSDLVFIKEQNDFISHKFNDLNLKYINIQSLLLKNNNNNNNNFVTSLNNDSLLGTTIKDIDKIKINTRDDINLQNYSSYEQNNLLDDSEVHKESIKSDKEK